MIQQRNDARMRGHILKGGLLALALIATGCRDSLSSFGPSDDSVGNGVFGVHAHTYTHTHAHPHKYVPVAHGSGQFTILAEGAVCPEGQQIKKSFSPSPPFSHLLPKTAKQQRASFLFSLHPATFISFCRGGTSMKNCKDAMDALGIGTQGSNPFAYTSTLLRPGGCYYRVSTNTR